ncbi:MAG: hypothetical protein ABI970_26295, partial [Chloroflexota bacterium]
MGNTALIEGENKVDAVEMPIEAVQTALQNASELTPETRQQYAERLLVYALESRDPAASALVAQLMDSDPVVDKALETQLYNDVQHQPDAVYAFIRAHLVDLCNECWLERLKIAAAAALQVAITDAAPTTSVDWLTLIGREPAKYELGDILHSGLLAAQSRAHHEPELARVLIT